MAAKPETRNRPARPFWRAKRLAEMTHAEWESLCDGCGKCCLLKLQDVDTDKIVYTDVACRLLDLDSCRCGDYANRRRRVPDCVQLTPETLPEAARWLPATCAYRRLHEGKDLLWWHPLVSGRRDTVHHAGASARHRAIHETSVRERDLERRIVNWVSR